MQQRLSRLRNTSVSRSLVRETHLQTAQLIMPLFINANITEKKPITSMPGINQLSLQCLPEEITCLKNLGINAIILFGIPKTKDPFGSAGFQEDGIVQQAIRIIRELDKDILIISDLCFCEYTDHGHCGVLNDQRIDTDKTLEFLALQALSHAKAGADWVAPSGMTDGMVRAIRQALDENGFNQIPILSYSAKYCSCLYSPFREAAQGAPQFGDRKSYQMDPANGNEALRESSLDIAEGADMLMIKPALFYLDIIYRTKQRFPDVPLCAYQVSGEFAMIKAAAEKGMLDAQKAIYESLISIKRAGADFIITYFAKEFASFSK